MLYIKAVLKPTYLQELFDMVNAQNILGFIGDIGLYRLT